MSRLVVLSLALALVLGAGCAGSGQGPRVIFLDGAGWYTGDAPVRAGLRQAGFAGAVERFGWSSLLGPLSDHLLAGENHPKVDALANRIVRLRKANPDSPLILMGLSAGTGIIVNALEKLPPGVMVDHVVLLSPSVSSRHDLSAALEHVRGRLYATNSPHDTLLSAGSSAGLERGAPVGRVGFRPPSHWDDERRRLYRKVVNLPWQPEYAAYGWDGGHVSATSRDFIRVVLAPRIMDDQPHPLDVPMVASRER